MFSLSKKPDVGYIIKTAVCIVAFFASIIFFSYECKALIDNYIILIMPTAKITVPWMIKLGISSLLFLITIGIVAILVRPIWLAIATCGVGMVFWALIVWAGYLPWIIAAVAIALLSTSYFLFINAQLKNQINFSTHPLGDKKMLLCTLLAIFISVSFGLGYVKNSTQRSYLIPPEFKKLAQDYVSSTAKALIEKQYPSSTAKQKKDMLESALKKSGTSFDDTEKSLKPYKSSIPILFGVTAFFIFQMVFLLLAILNSLLIKLVFLALKAAHFTNTVTEKCETKRLTLKTVEGK